MEHKKQIKAFTLVELIVVVTILAILSTIGFVSYSGYLTGVRDTNRISSLTAISDGLELYRTKNDLPLPDDSVEVKVEGTTIARQGYVGKNVLQTIEYSKAGKDPKDDSYYSYYLTDDNKYYQLMAFLEESDQLETNALSQATAATNYSNRHPKVYGKRLGILTADDNTPIQEVSSIATAGELDITSALATDYISRYSDEDTLTASGTTLISQVLSNSSCKRIKQINSSSRDGVYTIDPTGSNAFSVYCMMSKNGGGWTLVGYHKDSTTKTATTSSNINTLGFLNDTLWGELKPTISVGFTGLDENDVKTYLTLDKWKAGNCTSFDNLTSLTTNTRFYNNENTGCDLTGSDYSTIIASDSNTGVRNHSTTKMDIWDYANNDSDSFQDYYWYYVK